MVARIDSHREQTRVHFVGSGPRDCDSVNNRFVSLISLHHLSPGRPPPEISQATRGSYKIPRSLSAALPGFYPFMVVAARDIKVVAGTRPAHHDHLSGFAVVNQQSPTRSLLSYLCKLHTCIYIHIGCIYAHTVGYRCGDQPPPSTKIYHVISSTSMDAGLE